MRKIPFAGIELTSQRVRRLRGTSELPGRPAYGGIVLIKPRLSVALAFREKFACSRGNGLGFQDVKFFD